MVALGHVVALVPMVALGSAAVPWRRSPAPPKSEPPAQLRKARREQADAAIVSARRPSGTFQGCALAGVHPMIALNPTTAFRWSRHVS